MVVRTPSPGRLYWIIYFLGVVGALLLCLAFYGFQANAQGIKRYTKPQLEAIFFQEVERAGKQRYWKSLHAQVSQESGWRNWVKSRYAQGVTQFTSPTRGDWYPRTKPSCEGVHWSEPACGFRAQILYMGWLYRRYEGMEGQKAMAQCGYNGGAGYIDKQRRRCRIQPWCRHNRFYGHVEKACRNFRAEWACKENNEYPKRIQAREDRLR